MRLRSTRARRALATFSLIVLATIPAANQSVRQPADRVGEHVMLVTVRVLAIDTGAPLYQIDDLRVLAGSLPARQRSAETTANESAAPPSAIAAPSSQPAADIAIVDAGGSVLHRQRFTYPVAQSIPPVTPGEPVDGAPAMVAMREPEVTLVLPYFATARRVDIYDGRTPWAAASRLVTVTESLGGPDAAPARPQTAVVPGSLNILLLASGYLPSEMARFEARAAEVRNAILGTPPFAGQRDNVRIAAHENTSDLGCHPGCNGIDRLMCCDGRSVVAAAVGSGVPYDEIVVIHNTSTYAGGGSLSTGYKDNSYSTYCSVYDGPWTATMAVHEFGHSFGCLCDEYVEGAGNSTALPMCVNCRAACDQLEGASACSRACEGRSDYFRPETSVMFTLSASRYNTTSVISTYAPEGLQMRLDYFTGGSTARGPKGQFPPRNEVLQFRDSLETYYRETLKRSPELTSVDIEGEAVWLPEYLRYRLTGCSHDTAAGRVVTQIGGLGIQPVCGPTRPDYAFPPRNETLAFRVELERLYRDDLHSAGTLTAVDIEGNAVWLQEYLRYRLTGCSHAQAASKVMLQIAGQGIQPVCGG